MKARLLPAAAIASHRVSRVLRGAAILCGIGCVASAPAEGNDAAPDRLVYKTIGERKLVLEVNRPPDWKPTDRRPAIVFFFGGGWRSGTTEQFRPQAEHFARRGLVCFRADYRVRSRDGVLPDRCVEDALDAMRWVHGHAAELGIDPGRIVAAGGSAGGHLAACTFLAADEGGPISPKPGALLLYNPVVDLVALRSTPDKTLVEGLDEEVAARISPSLLVGKSMPPTLVMAGTQDRFLPQIRGFAEKAKATGALVETSYPEGQRHGYFNRSPWLERTTAEADAFLRKIGYLADPPKP